MSTFGVNLRVASRDTTPSNDCHDANQWDTQAWKAISEEEEDAAKCENGSTQSVKIAH